MKTTTAALAAALNAPVQQPGILVQMGFSPVQRWSSQATTNWAGETWQQFNVRVDGLMVQPLRVAGTLVFGNADDAIGTLVLSQGVQDIPITIWGFDAAAISDTADAVWLCAAVGAGAQVAADEVRISLRHRSEFTQSPRTYVSGAAGFTHMLPADTVLRINGIDMRLDRRG